MFVDVEFYVKFILEYLYEGFMRNPPFRIYNTDVERYFGKINNITNFKIAREKLIQEGLIYGKNVNFNNPHYFEITGAGLIYYEEEYVISDFKREFTLLVLKILTFLRDMGDKKYDISKYVNNLDERIIQVKFPLQYINRIMKDDYNYEMNDLKWKLLYFTSGFISKHIMEINGISITNDYLTFHNPYNFCLNLEGYNFLKNVFLDGKSQDLENNDKINFLRVLLDTKECEFLDFKLTMYDLLSDNIKSKWVQRKEFLKDVLSLINNKKLEKSTGKAYILIGVGEKNERYNGTHRNIEFIQYETLIHLINEYITPKLNIEFEEYYISGDKLNKLISNIKKEGYDRNILIKLTYEIGTVYEIKKKVGNPNVNVPYYYEGTSFTRDDSYTRMLTQEDRERIMSLFEEKLIDEYEIENYEEDFISEDTIEKIPLYKIDTELIEKYTEILKTKDLSPNNIEKILDRIRKQIRLLSFQKTIDDVIIRISRKFVKFSCNFIQDKNDKINKLIILILNELSIIPDVIQVIKNNCFNFLKKKFNEGNRNSNLIYLLNSCGYFQNLIDEIIIAIDNKDIPLLDVFINFDFNTSNIKTNKWEIIVQLIDKKESLVREEDDKLIERIQKIIEKFELIK